MQGFELGNVSGGFDLESPVELSSNRRRKAAQNDPDGPPLTPDGRLDLEAIRSMIKSRQLKEAARLLHHADEELPDLAKGLNLAALHAFEEDRHHAAQMLWKTGRKKLCV